MTIPIIALDFGDQAQALAMVDDLGDLCRFYKVGNELFTAAGPPLISALRGRGCDVFVDLKFHDIPNTVSRAIVSVTALGASLVTVHATGGRAMLRAAVESAGTKCGVLAVTVLTSLTNRDVAASWGREEALDVRAEVLRLSALAHECGAHGVVCSGHEAAAIRDRFGGGLATLVPGVRFAGGAAQDQARVVTPRQAAEAGARYVVVGRPVTEAKDPCAAMRQLSAELAL
jgi:orotidine-5'-phosphate decarboxylase